MLNEVNKKKPVKNLFLLFLFLGFQYYSVPNAKALSLRSLFSKNKNQQVLIRPNNGLVEIKSHALEQDEIDEDIKEMNNTELTLGQRTASASSMSQEKPKTQEIKSHALVQSEIDERMREEMHSEKKSHRLSWLWKKTGIQWMWNQFSRLWKQFRKPKNTRPCGNTELHRGVMGVHHKMVMMDRGF